MNKAVFLDRDGTINIEKNYLYKVEDFVFIRGTVEAIKIFHNLGYIVIVITNQAGVARGYYTESDVKELHNYIDAELIKNGTYVDAYYYCPHHPEGIAVEYAVECECRKPNTGMIEQAVKDFNINLKESFIIGDKEIDIQTGKNAGMKMSILVRSGHNINEANTEADEIYDDLLGFAQTIIQ
jgi:D-alpha,beta-D-heptose 1,7-bisphosphate phosphatase (EC 3.1.3.-)